MVCCDGHHACLAVKTSYSLAHRILHARPQTMYGTTSNTVTPKIAVIVTVIQYGPTAAIQGGNAKQSAPATAFRKKVMGINASPTIYQQESYQRRTQISVLEMKYIQNGTNPVHRTVKGPLWLLGQSPSNRRRQHSTAMIVPGTCQLMSQHALRLAHL